MSQATTIEELPQVAVEPCRLVEMWREAAHELMKQGEPSAAGAFLGCAQMLQTWIEHEGLSAIMCMPRSLIGLMYAAHEFDPQDKDTWKALGQAAHQFRVTQ